MQAANDRSRDSLRHGQLVVVGQILIFATLLALLGLHPLYVNNPGVLVYPVCVFLLTLFAWTLGSWRYLTGNLFDPYVLFIVAAFLFNAGLAFLEVLHLNKGGIFEGLFSQQTILMTLLLVAFGLTAFHLGALVSVLTMRRREETGWAATRELEQDGRSLRLVGGALICVAAIPTALVLRQSITLVSSSGYNALFQQPIMTGLGAWRSVLSAFLVPGLLFLLAGSKGKMWGILASSIIILAYCAVLFFLGDRGAAIMLLLGYVWLFSRCIHKVPRSLLAVIAVLLIFVFIPLFAAFRNTTGQARYTLSGLSKAYSSVKNPAVAGISEMGGSMQTISYTFELVPKTKDYERGSSYYDALLTAIPNLFWSTHPGAARASPTVWLIQKVDPYSANLGGGLGYSFIAEAYLNFGFWGVPMVLAVMGLLFGGFVLRADRSGDIARLAMLASFLSFFLIFARGQTADIVRGFLWYSFLPFLAVRFLNYTKSKNASSIGLAVNKLDVCEDSPPILLN